MDRNLTGSCSESKSFQTENIANIRFFKVCVGIGADGISCHVYLNISLQILNVTERSFTHHSLEHHTACYGYMNRVCIHDASSFFIVFLQNFFFLFFIQTFYFRFLMVFEKFRFMRFINLFYLKGMMCLVKFGNLERVFAVCLQFCQFLTAHL